MSDLDKTVAARNAITSVLSRFPPAERPLIAVSWKSSCVCIAFRCSCGYEAHEDTEYEVMLALRCQGCGAVYAVPSAISLVRLTDEEAEALIESQHVVTDA